MDKIKLSKEQKIKLLKTVRATIEQKLFGSPKTEFPDLSGDIFSRNFGLFVTLTTNGHLRGCIGYVEGIKPIREAVKDMAIQAAFHDPRFYPLKEDEYTELEIEISILYPLEKIKDINQIEVGRDGLVMERGFHKGLLLPQVATEHNWDRERFLNETCRKAGLESFAWENGAIIYKFEAEVFNEKEPGIS
jgi:AmmeMemoRadiSam system protein A